MDAAIRELKEETGLEQQDVVLGPKVWFSLEEILASEEGVYPVVLPEYLPDILSQNYPKEPMIDLAKKPNRGNK